MDGDYIPAWVYKMHPDKTPLEVEISWHEVNCISGPDYHKLHTRWGTHDE